ncbi:Na+/H+ antiporter subunit E [Mycobacteroides saopaulense]|uniref:Na+/H+ antiporter subunit E n=1 Tax=Mycobacteroides saopaulense TaxID=1578165 RepID=A0ABX3BWR3_9MYCO|nr:Na+/H+ antiporter subunit E [Mycobacteroides saopaulense]OHT81257.1 Na+/H+ antiporter subunit E [Mycobacteroides saopaulense]OHU07407.1 Na+/H+ antiporter subunit E [Mycobacteroides saopaulense]
MKNLALYGPREVALRAWTLVWLMLVWTMLWGNFSLANTITGLLVALVVTVLLPMPRLPVEGRLHVASMVRLAFTVAWYMVLSSLQVAWLAIRPGPPPLSAVLRAQVSVKSDLVMALLMNTLTIIPGSVVLEIDQERRLAYVHVLDVGSPKAVASFYAQLRQLEKLFISAFERDVDWHPDSTVVDESETRKGV